MATTTLFDLAVVDRADEYTGLIPDVTTLAPEFHTFHAFKRPGTWYKTTKLTSVPAASFRSANAGVVPGKAGLKSEIKPMFFFESRLQMDEAIMDADSGHLGSMWQIQAAAAMQGAAITIGAQTWYGTSADSAGFAGVRAQLSDVVKAGGTTNSTSAYLCWMDEQHGCRYDVGNNGSFEISAPLRQQVTDANDSTKSLFAYVGNLKAWLGYNQMSNLSSWAVTGITSTAAQNFTDKIASQLFAKIPRARRNNLKWFINRDAENYLQLSRTTINPGIATYQSGWSAQPANADGRPAFAPTPLSCLGWEIVLTDSVLSTETNTN